MSDQAPERPGIFASTRIRVLFALSGVLALASAGLLAVIVTADQQLPAPAVAEAVEAPASTETPAPASNENTVPGDAGHSDNGDNDGKQMADGAAPPQADNVPETERGATTESEPPPPPQQAAAPVVPQPPVLPPLPPMARDSVGALAPAPDPGLVEQSPDGLLPRIGTDGRQPWQAYARPFNANEARPRVAIVLASLGLSSAATESAIQGLPGGVTLTFQPYADNLQQWINLARAAGHEVLINLPLEPLDYPTNDPGPQALFTAFEQTENLERLNWALSRVTGYVGVSTHMGSRFTTSREAMAPVIEVLHQRGLLFFDTRSSARSVATALATEIGVPRAINDRFLDAREVSRTTIDARLAEIERIAREVGVSVAVGQAYPVTIERIREWVQTLEGKGLVLTPISAIVNLQADR